MSAGVLHGGVGDRRAGSRGGGRLLLVGGGPACASVLIRLAERPDPGADPTEIVLVDPACETGGGSPYPTGVSPALLTNDPVSTMDSTGIGFAGWLDEHRIEWWSRLTADPDPRVVRWVRRNGTAVAAGTPAGLFVPRFLFGDFIRERFAAAVRSLVAGGVPVRVVPGWVTGLRPEAGVWRVWIDGRRQPWGAGTVVLGMGSLPRAAPPAAGHPAYLYQRRARDPDTLAGLPAGPAPVVVLGAGAAACEALYLLEDAGTGGIVALSRAGRLPEGLPSGRPAVPPEPWTPSEPTAAALVGAVVAAIDRGRAVGHTITDLLPVLRVSFDRAFAALTPAEKGRFVTEYAPRYRAAIRHVPPDYDAATRRLRACGRLTLGRGEIVAVTPARSGLRVSYLDRGRLCRLTARAVLDCRGFTGVHDTDQPAVVDLLAGGVAAANPSGRGLAVDAGLAAAPGLYVLGPALSGTSNGDVHIWSLENVPRIWTIAERVAAGIRERTRSVATRAGREGT